MNMKTKVKISLLVFALFAFISFISLNAKIAPPKPCECPWGYSSTTTWSGNCYGCSCHIFSYTGRDRCTCR